MNDPMGRFAHLSIGISVYESYVALAEQLAAIAPAGLDTVFLCNSGSETVEAAIKLARQHTGRQAILTFRGGFHGRTIGAATLTTSKAAYRRGYGALLPEVYVAPYPYPLACRGQGGYLRSSRSRAATPGHTRGLAPVTSPPRAPALFASLPALS